MMIFFGPDFFDEEQDGIRHKAWMYFDKPLELRIGDELEFVLGRCCDPMMTIDDDPGPEDPSEN